jgi:ElaB/YqjD/DUF883 family membrane-anchored ribosome-binding protein
MFDIRTQLKNAIDALAHTAKNATDWVADKSDETIDSMRQRVVNATRGIAESTVRAEQSVRDGIADAAAPAAEMCATALSETKAAAYRANQELTDTIRKHPLTAIAIGFGIGLMLGRQFRRD